jgi:hypothetical protein
MPPLLIMIVIEEIKVRVQKFELKRKNPQNAIIFEFVSWIHRAASVEILL